MTTSPVSILHLSDLHLGKSFSDVGVDASEVHRAAHSYWTRGGLVTQAHDPFILACLRTNVKMAARQLGLLDDTFDLMVVTGDISTAADSEQRFQFARTFLTSSFKYENSEVGLQFPTSSVLCVPGNHDKLNEQSCERYLAHFSDLPSELPYIVERRCKEIRFVFYGIDSNLYQEGNVAKGHISTGTLGWLSDRKYEAQKDNAKPAAIRILLLHHHPCDLNKFRRQTFKGWFTGRLSQLDQGDRVLDLCRDWIKVIMHGHEHFPISFRDETSGAVVVSAGTTSESQLEKGRNSFFVLVFKDSSLIVSEFRWSGGGFRKQKEQQWPI
jgi:DNA repair exonuclease SbcCD nuclease subunit